MRPRLPSTGVQNVTSTPTSQADQGQEKETNILIIGGGPVGLLLALLLAKKGMRSAVLESLPSTNPSPRAIAYSGPTHQVFQDAGIYDDIVSHSACTDGFSWRKPLQGDGKGGYELGPVLAEWIMGKQGADGKCVPGEFVIQYPQSDLGKLLRRKLEETGLVTLHFSSTLKGLTQDASSVVATVKTHGTTRTIRAKYAVGCDGGQSFTRKLLGIKLIGHNWPERFLTTDVLRVAPVLPEPSIIYIMDPKIWAISTPLGPVKLGEPQLWRYSMNVPDDSMPDEEVVKPENIDKLLLQHIDGPRPSSHKVVDQNLYRMSQFVATTMFRGRCFLAGDAAHTTNPIGGLGLCTGILDADALAQAFDLALNKYSDKPEAQQHIFATYSDARRRVFQLHVSPFSSSSKLRLHSQDAEQTAAEDWYLRTLRSGNEEAIKKLHEPLLGHWRSDIAAESGL
ncbi:FAD/NAD(P)-binding domain-containing protein [Cadophora sp. DSE1049]|nr:FAD/NAD(P)-binding domain-containing protein [Cadophora sp. DSE1049]